MLLNTLGAHQLQVNTPTNGLSGLFFIGYRKRQLCLLRLNLRTSRWYKGWILQSQDFSDGWYYLLHCYVSCIYHTNNKPKDDCASIRKTQRRSLIIFTQSNNISRVMDCHELTYDNTLQLVKVNITPHSENTTDHDSQCVVTHICLYIQGCSSFNQELYSRDMALLTCHIEGSGPFL